MAFISEGDRTATIMSDGLYCSSIDKFDPEFTTNSVDIAVNYLYPEP